MKKILIPLIATFAFILFVGILVNNPEKIFKKNKKINSQQKSDNFLFINGNKISLIVANTNLSRKNGLSGYKSLGENEGMLFVFNEKDISPVFWMKDMEIPIDIIWINDEKIIQIDKNVEVETQVSDENLKRYSSKNPIDFVLEVNAGYCEKNNISVGDSVDFSKANLE